MNNPIVIIMAGGLGKRMKSELPKVLNILNKKPMIYYVIKRALEIKSKHILIIVGKYKNQIKTEIEKHFSEDEYCKIEYIIQPEVLINDELKVQGTGDAVKCCIPFFLDNNINTDSKVLILSGDVPMIQKNTIDNLLEKENTLLVTQLENPKGCGRILFSGDDETIEKIVEEKDCDDEQRKIKHVNCGIYNLSLNVLLLCIPQITNNNKNKEYYLTDVVELAKQNGYRMKYYELPIENQNEILNINTQDDLAVANGQSS